MGNKSSPRLKKIVRRVLAVHVLFLLMVIIPFKSPPRPKKHLAVRTIVQTPAPKVKTAPIVAKPSQPPTPKKQTPPPSAPKKQTPPQPSPSTKKPTAMPQKPKQQPSSDPLALLKKALDENPIAASSAPPAQVKPLPSLRFQTDEIPWDYTQSLMQTLHHSLTLPEFGEVKIQLTLHQDGRVVKVIVMHAESRQNREYLEKNLPYLQFPSFTGDLSSKKESTFILTFCNE